MKDKKLKLQGIARIIMFSKNEDQVIKLLDDLLTDAEISKIHERIEIIACLKGGMSQRATQRKTHAGIATVTRGSQLLKKRGMILDKMIDSAKNMSWWGRLFQRT